MTSNVYKQLIPRGGNFGGTDYVSSNKINHEYINEHTLCVSGMNLQNRLICRRSATITQYDWFIHPGTGLLTLYNGTSNIAGSKVVWNMFYTLAVVMTGTSTYFYINGIQDLFTTGFVIPQQNVSTTIMANEGGINPGNGKLFGVRIYPYALTPT